MRHMKKLCSILLVLALSLGLCTFALANDTEFDPQLTVETSGSTMRVTVVDTEENNAILAARKPTLSVPCSYASASVTGPGDEPIDCTIENGEIFFVVAKGGTYTITDRTPAAPITPVAPSKPADKPDETKPTETTYPDVQPTDWYYEAVEAVTEKGLMSGTDNGFEPNLATSRAMIWTILARMDGKTVSGSGSEWYAASQSWASENGVSDGSDPNGRITREQFAAMLYRYALRQGRAGADAAANFAGFADVESVSDWARDAMRWAVSSGIINGIDGRLCPQGEATRAQIATMLQRYLEK